MTISFSLLESIPWNTTFELGSSTANKGWVVQETIFGGVAFCLQGTEEGLFGTKNLDCGCRVLCQAGKTASMSNQASTNLLDSVWEKGTLISHRGYPPYTHTTRSHLIANQSCQIGSNKVHLLNKICVQALTIFDQGIHTAGKVLNVKQINVRNVHAHRCACAFNNLCGLGCVADNCLQHWNARKVGREWV